MKSYYWEWFINNRPCPWCCKEIILNDKNIIYINYIGI